MLDVLVGCDEDITKFVTEISYQGTIPEPSTPHIGREVALVARTAAFVYI
jgi:hypothetical protein